MRYLSGVIIIRSLLILFIACLGLANAQLSTSLKLSKKQYLAGEPVIAVVTITNHAGRELTFASNGRTQWLDFMLKDSRGESVTPKGRTLFGKMTIRAGESLAREVDLAQHFQLSEPGNFSVGALVHMPDSMVEGASTGRELFTQSPGVPYWSQKVGIPGSAGMTREFRLLNFSGDQKAQIYAKIIDGRTGQNVRTFLLGDVLMLRKPLATVDRQQRMHVMFLATPTMWVHYQIDTDGKVVERQIHQRGSQGDPQLLTFADGTVRVANSIPYDPKAATEAKAKTRKASDRPPGGY
ncbi:MAG: hypothetical protein RLZZ398_1848 [Verrucomicrobiota bacterium]|jgi:hypothetical protein